MNKNYNEYVLKLKAFDALLNNSPDYVFLKDNDLNYITGSKKFIEMAGLKDTSEILDKSDYDIFDEALADKYRSDDRKLMETRIPIIESIEEIPGINGESRYSSTSKFLLTDDDGNILGTIGIARDATTEIELSEERELRALSQKMFGDLLEADITENKMLRIEGSSLIMGLGLSKNNSFVEAIDKIVEKFVHKDYVEDFKKNFSVPKLVEDYDRGTKEFSCVPYLCLDGKNYKWIEFKTKLYYSRISNTLRCTTFLKDLDKVVKDRAELKLKAETDALTGLLNRESIFKQINELLKGNGKEKTHALLFIDLDLFKQVNDKLGHLFGDKVLKGIGEKLKNLFRENDLVGRVGGDEFLVLLKNVDSIDDVQNRANSILNSVPFYHFGSDIEIYVTCSVGVAMYNVSGKPLEQLYEEADKAMYKAKNRGRNRLAFYDEEKME